MFSSELKKITTDLKYNDVITITTSIQHAPPGPFIREDTLNKEL